MVLCQVVGDAEQSPGRGCNTRPAVACERLAIMRPLHSAPARTALGARNACAPHATSCPSTINPGEQIDSNNQQPPMLTMPSFHPSLCQKQHPHPPQPSPPLTPSHSFLPSTSLSAPAPPRQSRRPSSPPLGSATQTGPPCPTLLQPRRRGCGSSCRGRWLLPHPPGPSQSSVGAAVRGGWRERTF